jgi:hypothetical protein
VSTVATPRRVAAEARPATTLADRLLAAVPLASIYVWLCIVYGIEAWKRVTPWLFTDELEMTQLARSIADTGHPARRGEPYSFRSLYVVLTAPVWLIQDVASAYSGVKFVDVFVMTSVVFPTYLLARMIVGRRWALFAAMGAGAAPALAYSSWLVEETLAYPYTAWCFLLITKAFVTRRARWIVPATVVSLAGPLVRGELIVLPIAAVFAGLAALWSSEWGRRRRSSWLWGDYVGFVTIAVGAAILVSGIASHNYSEWYSVTTYWKHRIFVLGDWAAGALTIGLGVIPVVLGLAGIVPARGEQRSRELRMFRCAAFGGLVGFGLYTAMKAAYISTNFETRIEERNLIYIAPVLFVATALVLERRRVNLTALALASIYGFYLIVGTPFRMDVQLYSDALGLAILQQANRFFEWTPQGAQWLLLGILFAGVALLLAAMRLGERRRLATGIAAALAVGLLAWNVTAQISAAAGTISLSRDLEGTLRHPFTWVDDVTKGKPTLYLAQGQSSDQDPEWLLEFWNRSIKAVSSLDATVGGPGPAGAPNITRTGQLYWTLDAKDPGRLYDYAVEDWPCVDFAGTFAKQHGYRGGSANLRVWRLIRLTKPNRLKAACIGIYPDGWSGVNDSSYFRYSGTNPGWLRIRLSRQGFPSSPVHVQLARIAVVHRTPVLGRVMRQLRSTIESQVPKTIWLRVPASGFAVRVVIDDKFVPNQVDPHSGDPRTLGALVDYRFFTKLPRNAKPRTRP